MVFTGFAGLQIEPPAVQFRPETVLVHIGHHVLEARRGVGQRARHRLFLEVGIHDDLVAVFIGVEEMQDVGGIGLEPLNVLGVPEARDHGEPGRQAPVLAYRVDVALQ